MKKRMKEGICICLAVLLIFVSKGNVKADSYTSENDTDEIVYCGEIFPEDEALAEQQFLESLSEEDLARYKDKLEKALEDPQFVEGLGEEQLAVFQNKIQELERLMD